jgi:WD40 repeat protein
MASTFIETEVADHPYPITLEIYLKQGPIYIELFCMSNQRYTIKEDADYVKASYALQKWCAENIVNSHKYDHSPAMSAQRMKKRPLCYFTGQYPVTNYLDDANFIDTGVSRDRMRFKPRASTPKVNANPWDKDSRWGRLDNTDIARRQKDGHRDRSRNSRKKQITSSASIDRYATVVEKKTFIGAKSPQIQGRDKYFSPTKKFCAILNARRSVILPSSSDVKERMNQTRFSLYESQQNKNSDPANFIKTITPMKKAKKSDGTNIFQNVSFERKDLEHLRRRDSEIAIREIITNLDQGGYLIEAKNQFPPPYAVVSEKAAGLQQKAGDFGDFGDRQDMSDLAYP